MGKHDIQYENISNQLTINYTRLTRFLDELDSEREFFHVTIERVLNSALVILAFDNEKVIGITGLEKKWGIMRSYVVVKKDYQGKRIAENLYNERLKHTSSIKCNIILAVVEKRNLKSINHCISRGYRFGGEYWGNLRYYYLVLNFRGYMQYIALRLINPLLRLINIVR